MKPKNQQGRKTGVSSIPDNLPVLIDANQAASIASTSPKFIRDRCADGTIKAVKVGRCWRINRDAFLTLFGLEMPELNEQAKDTEAQDIYTPLRLAALKQTGKVVYSKTIRR